MNPTLALGDTVRLVGEHTATVAGRGWRDETRVWVTFGTAMVPSSVPLSLLLPCPACGTLALNRHEEGCPL